MLCHNDIPYITPDVQGSPPEGCPGETKRQARFPIQSQHRSHMPWYGHMVLHLQLLEHHLVPDLREMSVPCSTKEIANRGLCDHSRGRNGWAASPMRQLLPLIQVPRALRLRSLQSLIESGFAIARSDFMGIENSSKTLSRLSCEPATFQPNIYVL